MSTDQTTSQLLSELSTVSNAVANREWSTGGLAGLPKPGDFGPLMSTANPLATLSSAGVGMLTPHVSFLAKPLDEFRGDSGAVSTPAQGMATAAADIQALADTFRQTSTTETSGWTGEAADGHRVTSAQFAEGITAIAEAAKTISGAIVGAGEEVVKALTEVTRLIGEAVGKMVPVMADGIARAPLTMGASIVEAITTCVGIATEYGGKIATVMGELLANGMNLMKLVNMVLTIVHAVTQLLQKLAKLAEGGDSSAAKGTPSKTVESGEKTATQQGQPTGTSGPATENAATSTGDKAATSGWKDPAGATGGDTDQTASRPAGAMTGAVTPSSLGTPNSTVGAPSVPGPSTGTSGAVPVGGVAPMAGAVSNTGTSGTRPTTRPGPGKSFLAGQPKELTAGRQATPADDLSRAGGLTGPMAMGAGARGQGGEDTEHTRRYQLDADDDTVAADDQNVIAASGVIGETPEPRPASESPGEPAT
jgi:uncharacterized protein YukE